MSTRAQTWVIVTLALALTAVAFLVVDAGSHSVSDTLYGWVPMAALIAAAAAGASFAIRGRG